MSLNEPLLFKKICGCLAGVACGDAMGMPTSMMSPELIRRVFPAGIRRFEPAPPGHPIHAGMVAGQVTDDTQQTLVVATSLLEDGAIIPEKLALRLLAWAERINAFGSLLLGPSSLRALQAVKDGKSVRETGMFGDTNGACMRIAPVGIIHRGNVERTVKDVALACLPTHNTDIAIAGAAAVACAVGAGIRGARDVDELIQSALEGAALGARKGNPWIGASIVRRTKLALAMLDSDRSEQQVLQDLYDIIGAGVATTETVPVCLALVKYAGGDPMRTITLAANLGGDADTVGAIAGSIAGAFAGINAFPKRIIETIEAVNHLDLETFAYRLTMHVSSQGGG